MFNAQANILLIDDDVDILESYKDLLTQEGYTVIATAEPESVIGQLPENWCGVVICDVLLPGISGLEVLERIISADRQIPVMMITGHGDVPMAVDAVKKGAVNFFEKPVSPEKLLVQVEKSLNRRLQVIEKRRWQREKIDEAFVGGSDWTVKLKKQLETLANSDLSVFLWGEIGTGRHLAATYLHKLGDRKEQPLVFHECVQHETANMAQLIEQTGAGTLIVKNIHHLSVSEQQYLIHALQRDEQALRLIVISDISLPELIRRQMLLSEFYYVFIYTQMEMVPLRKRLADVTAIFHHYVQNARARLNKAPITPDKKFLQSLRNKDWPGNVKELISVAELYAIGLLSAVPTGAVPVAGSGAAHSLDERIEQYEKQLIEDALALYQGRINDAAAHLNIPRKKLYLRMKKYGFDKKSYKL